jgi:hypothetical protein
VRLARESQATRERPRSRTARQTGIVLLDHRASDRFDTPVSRGLRDPLGDRAPTRSASRLKVAFPESDGAVVAGLRDALVAEGMAGAEEKEDVKTMAFAALCISVRSSPDEPLGQ